jgi:hypothetical protein
MLGIFLANTVSKTFQETNLLLIEENSIACKLHISILKSGGCFEISTVIELLNNSNLGFNTLKSLNRELNYVISSVIIFLNSIKQTD